MKIAAWLSLSVFLLSGPAAEAGEPVRGADSGPVVSDAGLSFGSFEENGFTIVPVEDAAPAALPGDLARPRLFEIVRPDARAITIGRILSSCGCLAITAPRRSYKAGERAFLELRTVKPPPRDEATYAFFVQFTLPADMTLRHDVFVESETDRAPRRETGSSPGPHSP